MNRSEIIRNISQRINLPQTVIGSVLDALTHETTSALQAGDTVDIHGLCKIKVEAKPERAGRNPATGAAILIPAKNVVKITPVKALIDAANP